MINYIINWCKISFINGSPPAKGLYLPSARRSSRMACDKVCPEPIVIDGVKWGRKSMGFTGVFPAPLRWSYDNYPTYINGFLWGPPWICYPDLLKAGFLWAVLDYDPGIHLVNPATDALRSPDIVQWHSFSTWIFRFWKSNIARTNSLPTFKKIEDHQTFFWIGHVFYSTRRVDVTVVNLNRHHQQVKYGLAWNCTLSPTVYNSKIEWIQHDASYGTLIGVTSPGHHYVMTRIMHRAERAQWHNRLIHHNN